MKHKQNFVIDYLSRVKISRGGSKYHTIIWPPGQVGIAFGSVKIKSIITTQEIINIFFFVGGGAKYLDGGVKISYDILTTRSSWDSVW